MTRIEIPAKAPGNSAPKPASQSQVASFRRPYPGTQPEYLHPAYVSSVERAPTQPLIKLPQTLSETTGPAFTAEFSDLAASDLTRRHSGEPIGERIIVSGRVLDENGSPLRNTPIEIWQANACGRYMHRRDQHDAPLDPNFSGSGHALTDDSGSYKFITIKPGSYPWGNHYNAWRPAHIHFSLFGPAFVTRLVTQMYFPGDPLLLYDPIFNCTADEKARNRLISQFDWENVRPNWCLAYKFDIVLRGRDETPFEEKAMSLQATTWQTIGPYFRIGLEHLDTVRIASPNAHGEHVTIEGKILDGNGTPVPDAVVEIWQADAKGQYSSTSEFRGFGRIPTDAEGRFIFTTIKPGAVPGLGGRLQAPHLAVRVMMRGLLKDLVTRMYFPGQELAADPVLQLVPEPRRATLVAKRSSESGAAFVWEIELQGARETVFFDC